MYLPSALFLLPLIQVFLDGESFEGGEVVSGAREDSMLLMAGLALDGLVFIKDVAGAILQKAVVFIVLLAYVP